MLATDIQGVRWWNHGNTLEIIAFYYRKIPCGSPHGMCLVDSLPSLQPIAQCPKWSHSKTEIIGIWLFDFPFDHFSHVFIPARIICMIVFFLYIFKPAVGERSIVYVVQDSKRTHLLGIHCMSAPWKAIVQCHCMKSLSLKCPNNHSEQKRWLFCRHVDAIQFYPNTSYWLAGTMCRTQ